MNCRDNCECAVGIMCPIGGDDGSPAYYCDLGDHGVDEVTEVQDGPFVLSGCLDCAADFTGMLAEVNSVDFFAARKAA